MTTSYATIAQLREYLPQTAQTTAKDDMLRSILGRAWSTLNAEAGMSWYGVDVDTGAAAETYPAAASRLVRCAPSVTYLMLPPYQAGSITAISEARTGFALASTDWAEDWGAGPFTLRHTGALTAVWSPVTGDPYDTTTIRREGWRRDAYDVTAAWGPGPAPDGIVEITLQLAVNYWRARERGGYDVLGGPSGPTIRAVGGLNSSQRADIQRIRRGYQRITGP